MKRLQNYCVEVSIINAIKTYIVSFDFLEDIIADTELLTSLSTSPIKIKHYIEYAKVKGSNIFFAFAYFNNRKAPYAWIPINCYKDGSTYYHVNIRDTWMCRECNQIHHDIFIMPMIEHDTTFYRGTEEKYPAIPSIFQKRVCENCGKTLLCHFLPLTKKQI